MDVKGLTGERRSRGLERETDWWWRGGDREKVQVRLHEDKSNSNKHRNKVTRMRLAMKETDIRIPMAVICLSPYLIPSRYRTDSE